MKNKRHALVTGGAGFIGSHMVDRLIQEGYAVTIFDNLSTGFKKNIHPKALLIQGDAKNPKDVAKAFTKPIDVVFHIAGCASIINSFTNPLSDIDANFIGTANVVAKSIEKHVSRFLYASSMTIYQPTKNLPVCEKDPAVPVSYYGITKYAAERFVQVSGIRKDLSSPFHVTSFRMFNVYGPRQSLTNPYQGVMAIFIGNVLRSENIIIFGDGKQSRDFVYIDDVVNAWVTSVDNKNTYNGVFNVGFGKDTSIKELTQTIIKAAGKDPKKYPILYKKERPAEQKHMRADIHKLTSATGWQPHYDLQKGLMQTIRWAQKNNK